MKAVLRDCDVHYEQRGTGRPLFLLHGWEASAAAQMTVMEPLFTAGDNWCRIYPDLPGHGATPVGPSVRDHDDLLELLIEFIDAVSPGERLVLGGWSWGAYLVGGILHHLLDRVDGVLLDTPAIGRDRTVEPFALVRRDPAFVAALGPDERWLESVVTSQSTDLLDRVRAYRAVLLPQDPAIQAVVRVPFSFDPDELAHPLQAPVVIVAGRQDSEVGYRHLWRALDRFPRATLAILDGAGHFLDAEKPEPFGVLVRDWLSRVEDHAPRP